MRNLLLILTILWLAAGFAQASDTAKEQRWKAQISDSLLSGEVCELKAGDTGFMGIYTESEQGPADRAVILAHGIGAHPDWPEVVHPLRTGLPESGWSTLSIQMPILANDAPLKDYLPLFDEASPRLAAAIDYLRKQGVTTIVIAGHSLGAAMAARFVADHPGGVDGLILISMGAIDIDDKMNGVVALRTITLPVLDLYGSRDLDSVVASAADRRRDSAHTAGNGDYRQLAVEGADHFYIGMEDELLRRVHDWLQSRHDNPDES
jgi:pimeloyl-ACP methyl ester carboxylesterase